MRLVALLIGLVGLLIRLVGLLADTKILVYSHF